MQTSTPPASPESTAARPGVPASPDAAMWSAAAPAMFVFLWSTGFVGMRYGVPYAEPFTFMAIRMALVSALFALAILLFRAPWPRLDQASLHAAVAGLLVHATYLSGVLYAIRWELPLAMVALIAGLQPILTALIALRFPGESLKRVQWLGLMIGTLGVGLMVSTRSTSGSVSLHGLLAAGTGLLGITLGTLYQKRFCAEMDMRTSGMVQFGATCIALSIGACLFESRVVQWTGEFIFALAWLSLALSVGAISLLYLLIRRGRASEVASLFFLTPSVTAVMGYLLFGESLSAVAVLGLVVSAFGVALVMRFSKS